MQRLRQREAELAGIEQSRRAGALGSCNKLRCVIPRCSFALDGTLLLFCAIVASVSFVSSCETKAEIMHTVSAERGREIYMYGG